MTNVDEFDRRSLTDRVADTLRAQILTGKLTHGQTITQQAIADDLGVSTVPVREAFIRLTFEGLIDARRARSFSVVRLSEQDILDIFWVHAQLTREITRRAVVNGIDIGELRAAQEAFVAAREKLGTSANTADPASSPYGGTAVERDLQELHRANFAFYRVINRAAQSPRLLRVLENTLNSVPQAFFSVTPEWLDAAIDDHAKLIECIEAGDADLAADLAEKHILVAGGSTLKTFTERGWVRPADDSGS